MPTYQEPPQAIAAILDAPRPPTFRLSPDHQWMALLDRPALPSIEEVAAPVIKVAGIRIDPRTNGPARENPFTAVSLRRVDAGHEAAVPIEVQGGVRSLVFTRDCRRLLMSTLEPDGVALWMADVGPVPAPRRLFGPERGRPRLAAAMGHVAALLPGDQGLICRQIPASRGPVPSSDLIPLGPRVEENLGRTTPTRTFADLLRDAHDEELFDHYLTCEVVRVGLDGAVTPLLEAAVWSSVVPSPDGAWVLAQQYHRPYSTQVPLDRFPRRAVLVELATGRRVEVADLPLADDVPVAFGSVRTGLRTLGWRADAPATLWWVEALDGGDAGKPADLRDALATWRAPFVEPPDRLATTSLRFAGVTWGDDETALVDEWRYVDRRIRTLRIAPGRPASPGHEASVVWDRSFQDHYSNPGQPLTTPGPYGAHILRRTPTGGLLLDGPGISPDGVHPFLDRFEWTHTERLWQARDPHHERLMDVLDDSGAEILTWRQSQTEVPNLWRRRGGEAVERLTSFSDWAPAFERVRKEVVTYLRADGLPLSASVYLPPGHETASKPAPALFWVYPSEFKRRSDAGQVRATENTFARPFGASHLFFVLQGWVVVDNPVLPIVAEGDEQPNDTYVQQLIDGAEAAVDALAGRGWIDAERLVVGGHSYGAFTTANLLAHTDLFRAGIARSGAYNRTLTPFGFQGEERTFWQAPDTYAAMSPFGVADRIDKPLLLLHGAEDANSGTWPMQSERFYQALKGLGAQVRWVELPAEDHSYRARESVGHALWEMLRWAELWTKDR